MRESELSYVNLMRDHAKMEEYLYLSMLLCAILGFVLLLWDHLQVEL
jgi:hypothetical protein